MSPAEAELRDALELLAALRPAADVVLGGSDPADDGIRRAWEKARERMRRAATRWADETP